MNEILVRWHYCWNLIVNAQERKLTVLATLNTLRRLVVGHTLPFSSSFIVMALCAIPSIWGDVTLGFPLENVLFVWKTWIAMTALCLGVAVFELVSYYELLYMRASVERKDSDYIHRYFSSSSAFWVYVPLMLMCAEFFAFILTGPLIYVVPGFVKSGALTTLLKCFFLLWAVDFYRSRQWISRSFKSAFRLVVIFAPLLVIVGFVEWGIKAGFSALVGTLFNFGEFSSIPGFIIGAFVVGMLVALEFFVCASLANTLYLRGKHTYSEDFFTK